MTVLMTVNLNYIVVRRVENWGVGGWVSLAL